jgi:lysozyme family protein
MSNFDTCLPIILRAEGGFVNDPQDPGGMTNLGVTKAVWDHWIGHTSTEAEMRALKPATVAPLYRAQYWNALNCDGLPAALALSVFDFGVNAGVGRAARLLQTMVGAVPDGHIGLGTLSALRAFIATSRVAGAVRGYQKAREDYYRSLTHLFPRFGKGWLARVQTVETESLRMA